MTRTELSEILERHRKWLAGEAGGQRADLRGAKLSDTVLRGADLYKSCLPLWCGGLRITLDRRQMAQLIYHFCSMECEDLEVQELQKSMYEFANEFAEWYGGIKKFPEV